jgi:hypothetical protein
VKAQCLRVATEMVCMCPHHGPHRMRLDSSHSLWCVLAREAGQTKISPEDRASAFVLHCAVVIISGCRLTSCSVPFNHSRTGEGGCGVRP